MPFNITSAALILLGAALANAAPPEAASAAVEPPAKVRRTTKKPAASRLAPPRITKKKRTGPTRARSETKTSRSVSSETTEPAPALDLPEIEPGASVTQAPPPPVEPAPPARDSAPDALAVHPAVVEEHSDTLDPLMVRPVSMEAPDDDTTFEPSPVSPDKQPSKTDIREVFRQPQFVDDGPPRAANTPADILTLGGAYFQRAELSASRGDPEARLTPVLPSLADVFLDINPSEQIRGFVRGRLLYDPLDVQLSKPQSVLDQFWFRFGLAHRVFVTAGRQQVRWGSSRIWNPTDFLQAPNPQPLDAVDLRTGVDMLKVNVPWEEMASSLWLIATADLNGPEEQPIRYGGAIRAEVVLGPSELALSAAFQQGRRPRYGIDWSVGLGPFDLNAEMALLQDTPMRLWERGETGYVERPFGGPKPQVSAGIKGTFRVADVYRTIFRLEGFYNSLGTADRAQLTWQRSTADYLPLFFGRAYGMAQVSIDRRSQFEPRVTLTALANLSDPSMLGRIDFDIAVLRDVVAQLFVEAPMGPRGTEFRFQPDLSVVEVPPVGLPLFRTGVSVYIKM